MLMYSHKHQHQHKHNMTIWVTLYSKLQVFGWVLISLSTVINCNEQSETIQNYYIYIIAKNNQNNLKS